MSNLSILSNLSERFAADGLELRNLVRKYITSTVSDLPHVRAEINRITTRWGVSYTDVIHLMDAAGPWRSVERQMNQVQADQSILSANVSSYMSIDDQIITGLAHLTPAVSGAARRLESFLSLMRRDRPYLVSMPYDLRDVDRAVATIDTEWHVISDYLSPDVSTLEPANGKPNTMLETTIAGRRVLPAATAIAGDDEWIPNSDASLIYSETAGSTNTDVVLAELVGSMCISLTGPAVSVAALDANTDVNYLGMNGFIRYYVIFNRGVAGSGYRITTGANGVVIVSAQHVNMVGNGLRNIDRVGTSDFLTIALKLEPTGFFRSFRDTENAKRATNQSNASDGLRFFLKSLTNDAVDYTAQQATNYFTSVLYWTQTPAQLGLTAEQMRSLYRAWFEALAHHANSAGVDIVTRGLHSTSY
jgi:hypothetical protein